MSRKNVQAMVQVLGSQSLKVQEMENETLKGTNMHLRTEVIPMLEKIEKQLTEVVKADLPQSDDVRAYLDNLGKQIMTIEQSLNKGPQKLDIPDLNDQAAEPLEPLSEEKMSPFGKEISELFNFVAELRDSQITKEATHTIVEDEVRKDILKWYSQQL